MNDSTAIDIECTGTQVAADVRLSYYPQPNTMDVLRAGQTTLGGRPAWVTVFRLHFHEVELKATDELVAVALIDVGRPTAAVLYISIPGTHHAVGPRRRRGARLGSPGLVFAASSATPSRCVGPTG